MLKLLKKRKMSRASCAEEAAGSIEKRPLDTGAGKKFHCIFHHDALLGSIAAVAIMSISIAAASASAAKRHRLSLDLCLAWSSAEAAAAAAAFVCENDLQLLRGSTILILLEL